MDTQEPHGYVVDRSLWDREQVSRCNLCGEAFEHDNHR